MQPLYVRAPGAIDRPCQGNSYPNRNGGVNANLEPCQQVRNGVLISGREKPMNRIALLAVALLFAIALMATSIAAPPAANLDQLRNGAADSPIDPANWVNGNIGKQTGHYVESYSIAYRARLTNLPFDGTVITLTIGYDIKHSDKHAIDYLTHYDRIDDPSHMAVFGHAQETIDPTIGVPGVSGMPDDTYTIPAPSSAGSPVPGQPTASYNALPANEVVMSIWNGDISDIQYVTQGSLTDAKSETRIVVTFTATASTAVLAWGGHIAWRAEWGYDSDGDPMSAGGISGSPYHMRLIDWNLNNLGNQDRSLSAVAVYSPPPTCMITPEIDSVCAGGSATFTVAGFDGTPPYTYEWTGPSGFTATGETITIDDASALDAGQYCATVTDDDDRTSVCCADLVVLDNPICNITGGVEVIPVGGTTDWCAIEAPAGMIYTYSWTGPGGFTATTRCITIGTAGTYEVTITDQFGCYSTCDRTLRYGQGQEPPCEIIGCVVGVCEGSTTEWCGIEAPQGETYTYAWTGPGGFTAATRCVDIGVEGTYELTITYPDGRQSTCDDYLRILPNPPCDIVGDGVVFAGLTVEWCAPAATSGLGYTYEWTGPNGFTSTSRCIDAGAGLDPQQEPYTYTVTVSTIYGCESTCSKELYVLTPLGAMSGGDGTGESSGSPNVAKISSDRADLPTDYRLDQNRPNPFNPTTEIEFSLPEASQVKLEIFNVMGQKVTCLVDEFLPAGSFTVTWKASGVASGVYLYRLEAGRFVETKQMVLLK